MCSAAHSIARGLPLLSTRIQFLLTLNTSSSNSCWTPGRSSWVLLRPSPLWNPCSPKTIITTSAAFAAERASSKPLLSVVLNSSSLINVGLFVIRSAPFLKINSFPVYCFKPSTIETPLLSSEAMRQLPKTLLLSSASGPITAIFWPCFLRGSKLFSFFKSTIDFLAISRTALRFSSQPIVCSSRSTSQYL